MPPLVLRFLERHGLIIINSVLWFCGWGIWCSNSSHKQNAKVVKINQISQITNKRIIYTFPLCLGVKWKQHVMNFSPKCPKILPLRKKTQAKEKVPLLKRRWEIVVRKARKHSESRCMIELDSSSIRILWIKRQHMSAYMFCTDQELDTVDCAHVCIAYLQRICFWICTT